MRPKIRASLRDFFATEAAGGAMLLAATIVALVWANSPLSDSYKTSWSADIRHWINDGLMAVFFFVVGLEVKRELVTGELADLRAAALPAFAALGGMIVPATLYLALNSGGAGAGGWGIPVATDIAFAVGILTVLGSRIPSGLKIFLLSLAIVDDIGAIIVIALFYAKAIDLTWLLGAVVLLSCVPILLRLKVGWAPVYVALGLSVWYATYRSGVHATIAGVALGLMTPANPAETQAVPPAERLGLLLHPWTSFLIVPLFALANAGIVLSTDELGRAVTSRVALGITVGLVVGKVIGVSAASWLAIKMGFARLPLGVTWRHLIGAACLTGVGFTVSLFITGLAFMDPELVSAAKIGILFGSLIAAIVGVVVLRTPKGLE